MTEINHEEAERFLNNRVFKDAVRCVREHLHDKWEATDLADTEAQIVLKYKLQVLNDVVGMIEIAIKRGKIEEAKKAGIFNKILRGV